MSRVRGKEPTRKVGTHRLTGSDKTGNRGKKLRIRAGERVQSGHAPSYAFCTSRNRCVAASLRASFTCLSGWKTMESCLYRSRISWSEAAFGRLKTELC